MGYLLGMGETFTEALQFTVVLLVASIPIAIEIVCTTTLALGSRQLSEHGAIVTRLAAIEDMAGGWRMGWARGYRVHRHPGTGIKAVFRAQGDFDAAGSD